MPDIPLPGDDGGGTTGGGTTGGTTGGSTTTTGGSSSSSSSSSSTSTPKTEAQRLAERRAQNAIAELQRSYLEVLRRLGIKPSKNLMNLVEKGIRKAWSTTMFMAMLRHTPEYHQRFRGIQWRLGMSESQYTAEYAQFKARAQDIGVTLNRKLFGKMLKNGISFEEFSDRVNALSAINTNPAMWQAFTSVLQERGIDVPSGANRKRELMRLVMGRGSQAWENVYQEFFFTTNLEQVAGVEVIGAGETAGEGPSISRESLLKIIRSVEALSGGKLELEKQGIDFAGLGQRLRKYNLAYLQRYGMTYEDLVNAELGGPGAAEQREKAERIQATQEAFNEPRAESQTLAMKSQQRASEQELPQTQ